MKRDPKFLSRRTFLCGAAGVTVGLPLLESIGGGPLLAQTTEPVKRFLSFHCSNGVNDALFWPSGNANSTLSAANMTGRSVEPLIPYADRILIPRGIHGYPVGTWSGHQDGTAQALTAAASEGWENGAQGLATGISIDQVIANALNPPGREAFVLRPGPGEYNAVYNSISYRGPKQLVPAESNPYVAYRAMVGANPDPLPGGDDEVTDRLMRRRQSVIDLAREEFEELRRMDLSAADREKLEQHFALFRDVELGMVNDPNIVACVLPPSTAAALDSIVANTVERNENFPTMARHMAQIAVLSLACQYTRSTVLMWGGAVMGSPMYQWDGMSHNYRHHPLSHGTTDDFNETPINGYQAMLAQIDRWTVDEFRKLLDQLDAYSEADGQTLLDNTVVLYTNEFSHGGGHTTGNLPYIVAGGTGYFEQGQSILVGGGSTDNGGVGANQGQSNRMLCNVLNAVGVPTSTWQNGTEFSELKAS
jgi:hypothetical protein